MSNLVKKKIHRHIIGACTYMPSPACHPRNAEFLSLQKMMIIIFLFSTIYIYKYVAALQFFRLFVLVFHCILTLPHSIYTFNFRMLPKHYQVSYIEKITMTQKRNLSTASRQNLYLKTTVAVTVMHTRGMRTTSPKTNRTSIKATPPSKYLYPSKIPGNNKTNFTLTKGGRTVTDVKRLLLFLRRHAQI